MGADKKTVMCDFPAFVCAPTLSRPRSGSVSSRNALTIRIDPFCNAKQHNSTGKGTPDVSVGKGSEIDDGPLGRFAIATFRRVMQPEIGWKSRRDGYDGFVEECRMLLARASPEEQQLVVFRTLNTLFQAPYGPETFRRLFSDKPWLNSQITPLFFKWLVGPCYANRPDGGGYGVFIEKCRFLDESGCKGLCVNMCQQPTQRYFTDVLGLPVRMTPNYDDSSCQMTFGIPPLAMEDDPAVTGDCLAGCKMSPIVNRSVSSTCYSTKTVKPSSSHNDTRPPTKSDAL